MKQVIIIWVLNIVCVFTTKSQEKYSRVHLSAGSNDLIELSERGLPMDDILLLSENKYQCDLSDSELESLADSGVDFVIVQSDIQAAWKKRFSDFEKSSGCSGIDYNAPENFEMDDSYAGFYRYEDMLNALDEMHEQYPHLITIKTPISDFLTHEGRPIYYVVISDNPEIDEDEPKVLYTSIHHAREPLSLSETIYYMWHLLENYDTDEEIDFLVENTQMYFVPCVNPDGYVYNETTLPNGYGMHRKNMAPVGTFNPGVDLNRNYGHMWGTTGINWNENGNTYPGTEAFSEPETQAMRWLMYNNDFRFSSNAHTYGELLLYPIGAAELTQADHHYYFKTFSEFLGRCINYNALKSSQLYPSSGGAGDYSYIEDIGVQEKDTIFSITPEVGIEFWPAESTIVPSCSKMVLVNKTLAHMNFNYYGVELDYDAVAYETQQSVDVSATKLGLVDGSAQISLVGVSNVEVSSTPILIDLELMNTSNLSFSYSLNDDLVNGDVAELILEVDYGTWVQEYHMQQVYGFPETEFTETAENLNNWSGEWGVTDEDFVSPSQSYTDSPNGNSLASSFRVITYEDEINLQGVESAVIRFYAKWDINSGIDYCQFQISSDEGNSWEPQCGIYTVLASPNVGGSAQILGQPIYEGEQDQWVHENISLNNYLGQSIYVRFVMHTNGWSIGDGFYFDDFELGLQSDPNFQIELANDLKVFPNPTSQILNVEVSSREIGERLFLYNSIGSLVQSTDVDDDEIQLHLSGFPKGLYHLVIESEGTKPEGVLVIVE